MAGSKAPMKVQKRKEELHIAGSFRGLASFPGLLVHRA
jgi:hypothetical protein